jgi:hypothetical protein
MLTGPCALRLERKEGQIFLRHRAVVVVLRRFYDWTERNGDVGVVTNWPNTLLSAQVTDLEAEVFRAQTVITPWPK